MLYKVYTDGACSGNGTASARAGFAYVIVDENDNKIASYHSPVYGEATNQRAEMLAIITACEDLLEEIDFFDEDIFPPNSAIIYSDSAYCINCYQQGWYRNWELNGWVNSKKEPVANKDLWLRLMTYFEHPAFDFQKVKGHTGEKDWNDYVDILAKGAVK